MAEEQSMSKAQFVLSQRRNLSAKKVVERAKQAGIELTEHYVYNVRSKARMKKRGRKSAAAAARKPARKPRAAAATSTDEAQFRRLALELGLDKAEQVLSQTKQKVDEIIAGK